MPVAQNNSSPIDLAKLFQEALDPVALLPPNQLGVRIGCIGVRKFHFAPAILLVDREHQKFAAAETVNTIVCGNRQEQGTEWALLVASMEELKRPKKGCLSGIFRGQRIA